LYLERVSEGTSCLQSREKVGPGLDTNSDGFFKRGCFFIILENKVDCAFCSMKFSMDEKRDRERSREFLFNCPHKSVFHTGFESHFFRFSSNDPSNVYKRRVLTSVCFWAKFRQLTEKKKKKPSASSTKDFFEKFQKHRHIS